MAHTVSRHTGNVLVVFALLLLALVGLDQLMAWLGWSSRFDCWLRPILMSGQLLALWAMSIGVLLALFPKTRPIGRRLIIGGIVVAILPGVPSAHLGPLCGRF